MLRAGILERVDSITPGCEMACVSSPAGVLQTARFEPAFWDAVYDRYVNTGAEKLHLTAQRDSRGELVFSASSLIKSRVVGYDRSFSSVLIMKKSLRELEEIDKNQVLEELSARLYGAIRNGTAIKSPSLVLPSAILCFVDVKNFRYRWWTCCLTAAVPRGVRPLTGPVEPLSGDHVVSIYAALARFVLSHCEKSLDLSNNARALLLPSILGVSKSSISSPSSSSEWEVHRLEDIWDVRYNPNIYLVLSGGNDKGQAELPAYASNVLALLWHTRDITDVGKDEGAEETKEEKSLKAVAAAHRESLPVVTSDSKVVNLVCLRGETIDQLLDMGVGADVQRQYAQAKHLLSVLSSEKQQVQQLGDRSIVHSFRLEDLPETAECFEQCKAYMKAAAGNADAAMSAEEQDHLLNFNEDKHADLVEAVTNLLQRDSTLRTACEARNNAIILANKGLLRDPQLVSDWKDVVKAEKALLDAHESVAIEVDLALERPDADSLRHERRHARGWDFQADPARFLAHQPAVIDLASEKSPEMLLGQASQLNLSLMKWREWPQLKLEALQQKTCLLLGAGTLGCAVARCLLAWGFGSITLIDNGRVKYSNPTRQSLFELEDCYRGERGLPSHRGGGDEDGDGSGGSGSGPGGEVVGKLKAIAARDALHRIDPSAEVDGIELDIPSPGCLEGVHPEYIDATSAEVASSSQQLIQSIARHDIIFSLLDTREARWLPTLLTAAAGTMKQSKTMITAAIGFDSYVVMRHGCGREEGDLGCYFCSDFTSGAGGTPPSERPLDQQCSVTRPGLSGIVGGLAVEMAVQIVQAEVQDELEEGKSKSPGDSEIPHQIRGSLRDWSQTCQTVPRFDKCIACGSGVVDSFLGEDAPAGGDAPSSVMGSGIDFITGVCRNPQALPIISGLSDLIRQAQEETSNIVLTETEDEDEIDDNSSVDTRSSDIID